MHRTVWLINVFYVLHVNIFGQSDGANPKKNSNTTTHILITPKVIVIFNNIIPYYTYCLDTVISTHLTTSDTAIRVLKSVSFCFPLSLHSHLEIFYS